MDDRIEWLGKARFIYTLDLTKVYWQVALTLVAKEKTTFSSSQKQWQYRVLLFGLHGAPALLYAAMIMLCPCQTYATTYSI